jgi:tRNA/tmRNA/rRNA uracil-C5-methylase (TrmA/RlmC/RlmD family)
VYATDAQGRLGLRRHRSHEVELLEHCPLGVDGVGDHARLRQPSPRTSGLELARGEAVEVAVIEHSPAPGKAGRGRRPPDRTRLVEGPSRLGYRVMGRAFEVSAGGFWQVHPAAAQTLAEAVLVALAPQAGETALDLYAGAGLFTALLAEAVGPGGHVVGIESSRTAVADAARNLDELPWANVREGRVSAPLVGGLGLQPDLVVLDPPRTGAGAETMRAVLALCPRAVAYVACDPATLARDVAVAMSSGWRLGGLRAFDAFPMTAHVECVAILEPSAAGAD